MFKLEVVPFLVFESLVLDFPALSSSFDYKFIYVFDIMVVKEWLGHADVKTTCLYVEINIEMKRKALEAFPPPAQPPGTGNATQNWRKPGVMKFLNGLSRGTVLC